MGQSCLSKNLSNEYVASDFTILNGMISQKNVLIPFFRCLAFILVLLQHLGVDWVSLCLGELSFVTRYNPRHYLVSSHQLEPQLCFCKMLLPPSGSAPTIRDPLLKLRLTLIYRFSFPMLTMPSHSQTILMLRRPRVSTSTSK